jgi:hypothetical protein
MARYVGPDKSEARGDEIALNALCSYYEGKMVYYRSVLAEINSPIQSCRSG